MIQIIKENNGFKINKCITFFYLDESGEHSAFQCDFPIEFLNYFKDKKITEVYELFFMLQPMGIKNMEDAILKMSNY